MSVEVLIVGFGDLASAMADILTKQDMHLVGLRRTSKRSSEEVTYLVGDVTQIQTLGHLSNLKPDIVIYCVAADAQSDESYRRHYVEGLYNVLESLNILSPPRHFFFVSSTRVYGQSTEEILNEKTTPEPNDFGGERLLEAEALLKKYNFNSTILRLSGIYGSGRLRMIELAKSPQKWPKQNSWTNRIHREDAARWICYLIDQVMHDKKIQDCYIVTDDKPSSQFEVLKWIADKLEIDTSMIPDIPPTAGKRLSNKLMHESGFNLIYPDYRSGYLSLIY